MTPPFLQKNMAYADKTRVLKFQLMDNPGSLPTQSLPNESATDFVLVPPGRELVIYGVNCIANEPTSLLGVNTTDVRAVFYIKTLAGAESECFYFNLGEDATSQTPNFSTSEFGSSFPMRIVNHEDEYQVFSCYIDEGGGYDNLPQIIIEVTTCEPGRS